MKKTLMCGVAALVLSVGSAFAGGLAEPVMETEPLVEEAGVSGAGIVIPLLLLLFVAAVASSGGGTPPKG